MGAQVGGSNKKMCKGGCRTIVFTVIITMYRTLTRQLQNASNAKQMFWWVTRALGSVGAVGVSSSLVAIII
jgi:hypothetical protein